VSTTQRIAAVALAALLLVAGCMASLNPVFRDEDLVFDPAMLGVWTQPDSSDTWELSPGNGKSYWLVYTDKDGRESRFVARLANIDGTRFLDLFPEDMSPDANPFYKLHLTPIHTIYLVRNIDNGVELGAMDNDWLQKYLADHPDAIEHATFNGNKLITAPTDDVRAFVLKHKDAFTGKIYLERRMQIVD
jgi:hypothetical protein